jgi:hypothetical protein
VDFLYTQALSVKWFADADESDKLERLCRYISLTAISEQRLSIADHRKVRYELKTPYRDGTTHVFFDPIDFIGTLAALMPLPRLKPTRFGLPASLAHDTSMNVCWSIKLKVVVSQKLR